jgi:hypothetical protein
MSSNFDCSYMARSSLTYFPVNFCETILSADLYRFHPGTIPARFGLIWFSSFRGEDLNVIFNQNMPNLHNRYKSAERKIMKFLPCKRSKSLPRCVRLYKPSEKRQSVVGSINAQSSSLSLASNGTCASRISRSTKQLCC